MAIVVTGGNGQLGRALAAAFGPYLQDVPGSRLAAEFVFIDLPEWDIAEKEVVTRLEGLRPEVVIHCAAMTDVDGCARDPQQAHRVNVQGTENVVLACRRAGAEMVYISTNEVFDGRSDRPYLETDPTGAVNAYGASKLAGEQAAARLLDRLYIVRIAWLFSPGGRNFVSKILDRARTQGQLRVVTDEVANPTYAPDLARALLALIETRAFGTYHLVNEGYCSRFDFAREIVAQSGMPDVPVQAITSDMFQRASSPPAFAPLQNTTGAALGIKLRPWQAALRDYFAQG